VFGILLALGFDYDGKSLPSWTVRKVLLAPKKQRFRPKGMKKQPQLVRAVFLLLVFLLPVSFALSSEVYKWKDKDGKIFFSDSPPPTGGDVEIKKFKEDPVEKTKTKKYVPIPKGETIKEKRSYGNMNVIMYMTQTCPYCRKAREYIHSLGVNLTEYDVEKDASRREEMLSKSGGATGVPLIDVEGIIVRGFSPGAIKAAIEKRRNT